ncbi:MAG: hypothetical protein DCC55_26530 [Chloroflexi bacterium]|nr:MAG: hypothetical protein DCC55_26530 [Chloroflexota bacterium]
MAESNIPESWMTDNLFVLVGENPLPNYVAAQLLLRSGGTLHLVSSRDTLAIGKRIANLARQVGCEFSCPEHPPLEDPGSRFAIVDFFKRVGPLKGSVGLHYTGGTKAMAVHAFQEVRQQYSQAVCTYLDARTLEMRHAEERARIPVGLSVKPTVAELVTLHDIPLAYFCIALYGNLVSLYQVLAKAHETEVGQNAYNEWCKTTLRRPNGRLIEKRSHLPLNGQLCYPTAAELTEVAAVMRIVFDSPGDYFDPEQVRQKFTMQRVVPKATSGTSSQLIEYESSTPMVLPLDELVRYLDGTWVEHLTLDAFNAVDSTYRPHNVVMSLKSDEKKISYNFEFDVAAMRGYQLYAISCTRSSERHLCKNKLFEAHLRAKQFGGEEAKVGLVCCDKDPTELQKQVQSLWREGKEEVRVFGAQDLPHLAERFYDWLRRSGGSA